MNTATLATSTLALLAFALPGWSAETGPLADRDIDKHVDGDFIVHGDVDHVHGVIHAGGDIVIEGHIRGGSLELHGQRVVVNGAIDGGADLNVWAHGHCDLGPIHGRAEEGERRHTHVAVHEAEVVKVADVKFGGHLEAHAWKRVEIEGDVLGDETKVLWWTEEFVLGGHRGDGADIHKENWGDFDHR
jgi:hypothetical protein